MPTSNHPLEMGGQQTGNDIGWAVSCMLVGGRVRRRGWNGKGMYLFFVPGSNFIVEADRPMGKACPELIGKSIDYHGHVDMKTAQGYVVPWLCSQSDLLAMDWELHNGIQKSSL